MSRKRKTVSFDESTILFQKKCSPGPNVRFVKNAVPFASILMNYNREGSLGCGEGKYPQYKNGKYCCEDRQHTNQELLDYVNHLIESAIQNVSKTSFKKNKTNIENLIDARQFLLKRYPELQDNFDVPTSFVGTPSNYITGWFVEIQQQSKSNSSNSSNSNKSNSSNSNKSNNSSNSNNSKKNRKINKYDNHGLKRFPATLGGQKKSKTKRKRI
jgi:hypothetical protein